MNDIYLTVVVSTYNQEHYIAECLESIVANLPDKHCEVIVANDCSTDGTADVVDEFVGRYPFIRHLYREKNIGANLNYLDAHQQAQGKYVAHFDGDDVVRPGKFTQQIAVMDRQSDVNIVFHAAEYFSDDRSLILHTGMLHQDQPVWYFDEQQYASWGAIAVHSSYMYRRKSLDLKNIVVPFMEWQIAMATLQNSRGAFVNQRLVDYRYNLGGGAMTGTAEGRVSVYDIQENNAKHLFENAAALRGSIYAQLVVNSIARMRADFCIKNVPFSFLLRNIRHFSILKVYRSFATRSALRPRVINDTQK